MVDFSFEKYVQQQKGSAKESAGFDGYSKQKRKRAPTDEYAYRPDRDALRALRSMTPLNLAVSAVVRFWKENWRGELLGQAVKVTAKQFPDVYRIGMECAEELHLVLPPMYVRQNPYINAMTLGLDDDSIILINSLTIDHLSKAELKSVIGHECGHVKNGHVLFHTVAKFLVQQISSVFPLAQLLQFALLDWIRKSEITADRAGLICCRDPEAAKRTFIKLAVGSKELYDQLNVEEYLKQIDEVRGTIGKFSELFQTHPFLPKRVKAIQLFIESDYYQNKVLKRNKKGCLSMDELDKKVARAIRI